LFDIPQSALAFEITKISSGSVTASVTPDYGFRVESDLVGSEFTGSVSITGSLEIIATSGSLILGSSSAYFGEGTYLRNIPRSALTEDALISAEIKSGSVTASVSPDYGFRVISSDSGSEFTGSVDVSGSVIAQFFVGDGSQLTNVPAFVAPLIATGSVTASVDDAGFFRVESTSSVTIELSGSAFISGSVSASVFSGSGAGLFDIPRSAFTGDAFRIASGSVTASVSPNEGFKVESLDSGSQFTGSLRVSGSIYAESGSQFVGDGGGLRNIPLSALAEEVVAATKITTGSVTASVSPNFGFKVESVASGSEFTGSVDISGTLSASLFRGDGAGLFNIPRSAIVEEAFRIVSGSVTASVSPVYGFRVEAQQGSEFTGSVDVSGSISSSLFRGDGSGLFNIPISAISQDAVRIATGSVTASVSLNKGFVVQSAASGSEFTGSVDISGTLSASLFRGDGSGLFNIPFSALSEELTRIASGSVTASVSPNAGFIVTSVNSGSYFSGSVFVSGSDNRKNY